MNELVPRLYSFLYHASCTVRRSALISLTSITRDSVLTTHHNALPPAAGNIAKQDDTEQKSVLSSRISSRSNIETCSANSSQFTSKDKMHCSSPYQCSDDDECSPLVIVDNCSSQSNSSHPVNVQKPLIATSVVSDNSNSSKSSIGLSGAKCDELSQLPSCKRESDSLVQESDMEIEPCTQPIKVKQEADAPLDLIKLSCKQEDLEHSTNVVAVDKPLALELKQVKKIEITSNNKCSVSESKTLHLWCEALLPSLLRHLYQRSLVETDVTNQSLINKVRGTLTF